MNHVVSLVHRFLPGWDLGLGAAELLVLWACVSWPGVGAESLLPYKLSMSLALPWRVELALWV